MRAIWNGTVIAESDKAVVIEGNHYFPPDSLVAANFRENSATTVCPWKGTANYFDVVVGDKVNESAAWVYKTPKDAARNITNYVAFWRGVEVKA